MTARAHLSRDQRVVLAGLLQARLAELELERASMLQALAPAEPARQTLQGDADDARRVAGAREVEAGRQDIDSTEFEAIKNALQRIHRASYGLCIECLAAVPFARLRVEPQALRCAACTTRREGKPPQ